MVRGARRRVVVAGLALAAVTGLMLWVAVAAVGARAAAATAPVPGVVGLPAYR